MVTGASSGIGRAVAVELGRRRCRVALVARRAEALENVAAEVKEVGGEAVVVPADLATEEGCAAAVSGVLEGLGKLRLVVANAGIGRYSLVEEQPAEQAEQLIQINYLGLVHTVRHALPRLLEAAPGSIVGVTSSAGLIPHRTGSAYCASKAAAIAYLATLRLEVADRGVGVSWICPGAVRTPFFDESGLDPDQDLPLLARLMVRQLEPDEVARAVVRAVRSGRPEIVQPAMLRFFVVLRRLAPRLADWVNRRLP